MTTVGLCGFIGSGKNTVADILKTNHGFEIFSYADSLKDAVSNIFGWPRHLLEGNTEISRTFRETTDFWWSRRLDIKDLTPRWVLQNIGTDCLRQHFHPDIWIASLDRKIHVAGGRAVVTDCRFENEIINILKNNGLIVQVFRTNPSWIEFADGAAHGCEKCQQVLTNQKIHESEWRWLKHAPHHVINNTTDIDQLTIRVSQFVEKFLE